MRLNNVKKNNLPRKTSRPITGKTDFFFSSITTFYNMFTTEEIGTAKQTIYGRNLKVGDEYRSKFCVVKKEVVLNNK